MILTIESAAFGLDLTQKKETNEMPKFSALRVRFIWNAGVR